MEPNCDDKNESSKKCYESLFEWQSLGKRWCEKTWLKFLKLLGLEKKDVKDINSVCNPGQNIWHKVKKYSKIGKDFKNEISNFVCFLTAIVNV